MRNAFIVAVVVVLQWVAHRAEGATILYVSNENDGTIVMIDIARDEVVGTIRVGARPRGMDMTRDGSRLYVAVTDLAGRSGKIAPGRKGIAAIDTRTRRVVQMYDGGSDPEAVAVSADNRKLFVSNEDAGMATVLSVATGKTIATLPTGIEPEGVTASPDGKWVYVTAETSNTISVIDTKTNKVVKIFLVGARPRATAFSPDSKFAYISGELGRNVTIVDVTKHQPIGKVSLPADALPVGVVVSRDGKRVYVANGRANTVSEIDPVAKRVVRNVRVGSRAWGIALTPDGTKLYTANGLSDDVSVVDVKTMRVIKTIKAGDAPWGLAMGR